MRLRDSAADLFLGARCPGCGTPQLGLCTLCAAVLIAARPDVVHREHPLFPYAVATASYQGIMKNVLLAYKERKALWLAHPLAALLGRAVAQILLAASVTDCWLVPVPSSAASNRSRGTDIVADLGRATAAQLRTTGAQVYLRPGLQRSEQMQDQVGLDRSGRFANAPGRFRSRLQTWPVPVIIIDDIITTGATILESQRVITDASGGVIGVAVVAQTPLRKG